MTSVHFFNMDILKSEFQEILQIQYEIQTRKNGIVEKLQELKELYNNLVKSNTKKIFLFCLDSFYFQYKTLSIETEDICKFISLINNRMYGDYYKLYNIILMQSTEFNIDVHGLIADFTKKYTPYKEIEPFREYKISDIIDLHSDIMKLLNYINVRYMSKEQNIVEYNESARVGLSITSFMQTLEYENMLLKEQLGLYMNYTRFFHASQKTYLTKLFKKITGFQKELEDDILVSYRVTEPIEKKVETLELKEELPTEIEILLRNSETNTMVEAEEANIVISTEEKSADSIEISPTPDETSPTPDEINHVPTEPVSTETPTEGFPV